jgi:hypothetical protein
MNYADIYIDQGNDWSAGLFFNYADNTAVDLSGYTFNSAFKTSYASNVVAGTLIVNVVDALNGAATIGMAGNTSAVANAGIYVYDVIMTDPNGIVTTILTGTLDIVAGVTIS